MADPLPTETDAAASAETVFLTEYERGLRAAVLGAVLAVVLVALARRRTDG
jgi:hypothetical protein